MSLQNTVQSILNELCADPITSVPGAVVFAADRKGNTLAHAAAGVRGVDKPSEKMAPNQLFAIHSCTKLITAIAAMQLVEQGKLSLDAPIDGILPELKGQDILENGKRRKNTVPITLNHLLSHTSGQSYPFFNEQTRIELEKVGAAGFGCEKASIMAPLASEPGTRWEYGTGIDWAGQAVERVSGLDLDGYFKENIFKPLGITEMTMRPDTGIPGGVKPRLASMHKRGADGKISARDYLVESNESKMEIQYGGAGLYGNAKEYCQILVALLNDGQHPNGGRILKPESVKELMRDRLPEKLVPDLERPIVAAQPEMSNPLTILEGIPKQWALAGCKTPEGVPNGRSGKSVWWAGIANHYWWLDQGDGTCGMIQTQLLPFFDAQIVPAFFFKIEPAVHQHVAAEGSA